MSVICTTKIQFRDGAKIVAISLLMDSIEYNVFKTELFTDYKTGAEVFIYFFDKIAFEIER